MKRKGITKRFTAALAAAVLAVAMLSGCSSTDYSITANGDKVNAGVYINYLMNEMSSQMYSLYYSQKISDPAEALTQDIEVDGEKKSFKTYCKDKAMEYTKQFAAINAKFDELGLELTDEQRKEIKESVSSSWEENKDFFEFEGIGKESVEQITQIAHKRDAIFAYYYEEGGIEELTEADVQKYIEDNYIRYKQISFSKTSAAGDDAAADLKAKAEEYLALAADVDYEGFDALIEQRQAEEEAEQAEAEAADDTEGEAVTDTDSSADSTADAATEVEGTVSQAEAGAEAETESEDVSADVSESDDTSADSAPAADTELAADTGDTDADSSSDSIADGEEAADEEDEPADYDTLVNFTTGTDSEREDYAEVYANRLKEFKSAEYGKAAFYEDENAYYVYITADVAEKEGYASDNRDTLIHEMKDEDFEALITSWIEKMDIKINDKAVKRYSVQEIYDRQEEFYSKNE